MAALLRRTLSGGSGEWPEGATVLVDMFLSHLGTHASVFLTSLLVTVCYPARVTPILNLCLYCFPF